VLTTEIRIASSFLIFQVPAVVGSAPARPANGANSRQKVSSSAGVLTARGRPAGRIFVTTVLRARRPHLPRAIGLRWR
jgi:hypothetical protein